MSGEKANLEALIRGARTETPRGRWDAQRRLFGRLALGGAPALLLARAGYALGPWTGQKLGAAGVIGVAVIAAGIYGVTRTDAPPAPMIAATTAAPALEPAPAVAPATDVIPSVSVNALPTVVEQPPARALPPTAPTEIDQLASETASVRRIRGRLESGDAAGALAGTRAHRSQFRHSILDQEVAVLEIQAHHELGEEARACELGRAFMTAYPTSAHRASVASLVRSCEP